jgi:hypothetical protein
MKKLQLDLNQLAVESFQTAAPPRADGTVRANEDSVFITCQADCTMRICPTADSCDPAESCIDSCGESCNCPTLDGGWTCGLC